MNGPSTRRAAHGRIPPLRSTTARNALELGLKRLRGRGETPGNPTPPNRPKPGKALQVARGDRGTRVERWTSQSDAPRKGHSCLPACQNKSAQLKRQCLRHQDRKTSQQKRLVGGQKKDGRQGQAEGSAIGKPGITPHAAARHPAQWEASDKGRETGEGAPVEKKIIDTHGRRHSKHQSIASIHSMPDKGKQAVQTGAMSPYKAKQGAESPWGNTAKSLPRQEEWGCKSDAKRRSDRNTCGKPRDAGLDKEREREEQHSRHSKQIRRVNDEERGKRIGEASNPGPKEQEAKKGGARNNIIIETINVTAYEKAEDLLAKRNADVIFIQEHLVRKMVRQAVQAGAAKRDMDLHLGDACEVGMQATAGVGAITSTKAHTHCVARECLAEEARKYENIGRLGKYQLACHEWSIEVYNIYAYTNGANKIEQAEKTNDLIEAIKLDMKANGRPPCMILGDLNAEPKHIPALK